MITSGQFDDNDLVVNFPNSICGEVGEPLHEDIIQVCRALAGLGYWPLDFGEDNGLSTELWFVKDHGTVDTREQCEYFIKVNGVA